MALGKDRNRINVKGVEDFRLYELTSGGSATTMLSVGEVESVEITDESSMVESANSQGQQVNTQRGSQKVRLKVVLKQSSKEEIDLVRNAEGKYYHCYARAKLSNPTVYYQEWYFPLCKIKPAITLEFKSETERTITLEITVLMPKGAVNVTPSALNVSSGNYYSFAETATTAVGEVTTANGTVYSSTV